MFWKHIKSLRKDHVGVSTLSSGGKQVTDSFEKAELLNSQFHSVFTDESPNYRIFIPVYA